MNVDILVKEKNSDRGFYFPWLPDKIDYASGGTVVASYNIMNRGDVDVPTGSGLREVSWSGVFPGIHRNDAGMQRTLYRTPAWYHSILEDWRRNGTVLTVIVYCYPINLDVVLVEYSGSPTGGFGDWEYSLKFREKRELTLWPIKPEKTTTPAVTSTGSTQSGQTYTVIAKKGLNVRTGPGTGYSKAGPALPYGTTVQVLATEGAWSKISYNGGTAYVYTAYIKKVPGTTAPDVPSEQKRPAATSTTYTIKKGDTLWKIAQQQLGKGSRWQEILQLNQEILESTAQKHGQHCTVNAPYIYAGTAITLPAK